ncbi:hypothetical protein [Trichlorobacter ammonificans]|uniref:PepSY domain-containing protein n=1 Tax=Trichlorobacter ammonificans TaxID=2916410 RepID=A0ABM9D5M9_9BACT|nr:hypothetical protein [Trichlorobacter ammonificans]CAH2030466.1 conserved exported protein of unknown function [Trichlorobacter ammonificans]
MTHRHATYLLVLTLVPALAAPVAAQWPDGGKGERPWAVPPGPGMQPGPGGTPPFGGYCPKRHADRYGARQPVHTRAEALDRLHLFFGIDPARISRFEERRHVFLAEITDPEGRPVELVIIDRRTGRIRSIR